MRDLFSPFIRRKRPENNIAIPASFTSTEQTTPPTRLENRQTSAPLPSSERFQTGEPTSFHFEISPEYRRETILDMIARMVVKDGQTAVDALLLDAIRYFRPKTPHLNNPLFYRSNNSMSLLNFDATKVNPTLPLDVLPAGKYVVEITNSATKETKAKNGSYLELEMTVLDGEYKGRKLWDRLCVNHVNRKTQEIAQANLSALCHAINVLKPIDSFDLHGLPFVVNVRLQKNENTGEMFNDIRGYSPKGKTFVPFPTRTSATTQVADPQTEETTMSATLAESAPWAQ